MRYYLLAALMLFVLVLLGLWIPFSMEKDTGYAPLNIIE